MKIDFAKFIVSMREVFRFILLISVVGSFAAPHIAQEPKPSPAPVVLTAEQDHQRLMELLKITKLRPGANPRSSDPTNQPNYDEAKANPYPTLPDPLTLKNGKKVKDA